jgi:hypothetical protein
MAQTGRSEAIHSPEAWARTVLSRTIPAVSSIEVVCTVAISCWLKALALQLVVGLHLRAIALPKSLKILLEWRPLESGARGQLTYGYLIKLTHMEKTQVYLRKEELDALRKVPARSRRSVAALVREAVRKVVLMPAAEGPIAI